MQEVKNACMILNTAEYCQTTSLQVSPDLRLQMQEHEC